MGDVAPREFDFTLDVGDHERDEQNVAVAQSGASLFPELVWAHFRWQQDVQRKGGVDGELETAYRGKLEQFEACEGDIVSAYWSTYRASAIALTEKRRAGFPRRLVGATDSEMRLHRATDWATRDAPAIAEMLYRCDTLAIRISQVLRGPAERVAMQLVASVANHLLGFVDRSRGKPSSAEARRFAQEQQRELESIEAFYDRAGTKAGRIIYFWGMMVGVAAQAVILLALAAFFWALGFWDEQHTRELQLFFSAASAGAIGALISVLQRMGSQAGAFRIDYEVGRSSILRLGSFRPFIGAVSGVAVYFFLRGGLFNAPAPDDEKTFFYYGSLSFLAGFSERWTNVILGGAERMIGDRGRRSERKRER